MHPVTVKEAQYQASRQLEQAAVESPQLDARLLLQKTLQLSHERLLMAQEQALSADEKVLFDTLLAGRLERKPMAQLLGKREFWGHDFKVTSDTLTPRADSETLIEAALEIYKENAQPLRILELGVGTGCLLLTLLKALPNAQGVGIDISAAALEVAAENASTLSVSERVMLQEGNWCAGVEGVFDLIISNPPYIPASEIATLEPEVRIFEPMLALSGGEDGLDAYRAIAKAAPQHLTPEGYLLLEIGQGQADDVAAILAKEGLQLVQRKQDLAGVERCLVTRRVAI